MLWVGACRGVSEVDRVLTEAHTQGRLEVMVAWVEAAYSPPTPAPAPASRAGSVDPAAEAAAAEAKALEADRVKVRLPFLSLFLTFPFTATRASCGLD